MQILFFFVLLGIPLAAEQVSSHSVRIAIVQDGPSDAYAGMRQVIEDEVNALLQGEFQPAYSPVRQYLGNWTRESVEREVEAALKDPTVDLVVGLGLIASDVLAHRKELPKGGFAPLIIDPRMQAIPYHGGVSGVPNLNYLIFPQNLLRDVRSLEQLKSFNNVTLIADASALAAMPGLSKALVTAADEANVQATVIAEGTPLPEDTEAVIFLLLPQLSAFEISQLIDETNQRKIPSLAVMGRSWVELGALATLTPEADIRRVARRLALNIQRYLLGEPAADLKVDVAAADQLVLNLRTASAIGIVPSWEVLLDADTINEHDFEPIFHLTLLDAIDEAMAANIALAAARKKVDSGAEDVRKALAPLLPQVSVAGIARAIDKNLAQVALGALPEREFFGAAKATQVIYSNQLLGRYCIERSRQDARYDAYDTQFLDTVLEVTLASLDLLRANTLQDVQLSNVRRTRSNLRMAKQRVKSGEARSSEVFRWESEVATNRSNAVKAAYQVRSAQVALNRVLNRCQADPISLADISLDEGYWILNRSWFDRYIANAQVMEALGDFSVHEGCRLSPQINQVQNLIMAQSKALGVANRAYYSPDVAMAAEVRDRFAEGGAGTVGPLKTNGKEWIVGVAVTYPLLTGGQRGAEKRQACSELQRLRWELEDLQARIEQQIRTCLNNATASYAAIGLSHTSAQAAAKSLDMATHAYVKGSTTIVDLLDAQNQALVADLVAADAVYDFLRDLVSLQRAIGRFDFLLTENDRSEVLEHLNDFIAQHTEDNSCA